MTNKRQAFLIMMNQEEIIEDLTDEELGKIFRSIFKYERTKEIPEFNDRYLNSVFKSFKNQIDFSEENYNKICEKNKQNANKRWNKSSITEYDGMQSDATAYEWNATHTKNAKIREDNIREDKIREDNIRKDNNTVANATTTPTPIFNFSSILEYGNKKGATDDYCQRFYDYYKGKEWNNENDWKKKLDEWIAKDGIEPSIYQLKKVGEGVFTL